MRFTKCVRTFAARTEGDVALLFGLALTGLLIAAGMSLDYARAFSVQNSMQADLDSALLGAASQMSDPAKLQSAAQMYFDANWTATNDVGSVELTVSKISNTRLKGTAKAQVPTTLMKIAGFDSVPVETSSEIEVAGNDIELALVLDTTASMAGNKMSALKSSAKTLIDDAFQAPNAADHVKISVVPFGQYVNVGMANRTASWMDVPADTAVARESCYDHQNVTGTSNCRMETFTASNDGMPYTYQSEVCDYSYGPPTYSCDAWTEYQTWNGCTGSRDNPLDTQDASWSTKAPGIMSVSCGSEVMPLTNNETNLINKIDSLTTSGDTYIPAGLFWGWTALSKQEPFAQARDYGEIVDGKPVRKIMVLMTDGFNTLSPTYPSHAGNDTTLSNDLTAEICSNVKAKGIELYTVAFEVSNVEIKDTLEACATSSGHFFDADSADQLSEAFKVIASSFTPLRLAN